MPDDSNKPQRIVIVGGGFGGIQLVKSLKNYPEFSVTLIDKNNYHTFQPLLYQVASGGLGSDAIAYPFRKIFRGYRNFKFVMATVEKINHEENTINTSIGIIPYDVLVIATGSETNFYGQVNLVKWCMELKTIPQALDLRSDILEEFERAINTTQPAERTKLLNFVIVGGGPTGIETAGALAEFKKHILPHDYPELPPETMQVNLIEAAPRLLGGMSTEASAKAKEYLEDMGVKVLVNAAVKDYDGQTLTLQNGVTFATTTVLWSAGVKGSLIEGLAPTAIHKNSRYLINPNGTVKGYTNVYALGDTAALLSEEYPNGHPMVAQVAIQMAKNIAHNLKYKTNKAFTYSDLGSMATVGRHRAVVDLPFLKFQGRIAWFVWMFIHLMILVSFRNRVIVFVNWLWNYISYERSIRLIVRPFKGK